MGIYLGKVAGNLVDAKLGSVFNLCLLFVFPDHADSAKDIAERNNSQTLNIWIMIKNAVSLSNPKRRM